MNDLKNYEKVIEEAYNFLANMKGKYMLDKQKVIELLNNL